MKNNRVRNIGTEVLSDNWYILKKITFDYLNKANVWETQSREVYDRSNGATVLLYNKSKSTVVLTRQFRIPTYVNGNASGMLIEACAGLLDNENATECIKREIQEETGYEIKLVEKIFEAYMSPGSVTEILHFFIAQYSDAMKISEGGGAEGEGEDIQVMEIQMDEAMEMIEGGKIRDGKTIMLLQYVKLKGIL